MLRLKLQYFGHLMRRADSLEKTLMLGKIEDRRKRGQPSPTWRTWVWAGSESWWWTGKPGALQSMGSQRIGHDWVTELNQLYHRCFYDCFWISWAWNNDTVLLYCKIHKSTTTVEDAHLTVYTRHVNWLMWLHMQTLICVFESLQLKGSYVGDSLYLILPLIWDPVLELMNTPKYQVEELVMLNASLYYIQQPFVTCSPYPPTFHSLLSTRAEY